MPRAVIALSVLLAGCTCKPIVVPEYLEPPAQCVQACPYAGPDAIRTNGDLLEAYRGRLGQVACYESRLQCVRDAKP
jgi:hypothetical protein